MPEIKQDLRAVTFIVAANDSLHKNMADYVCDGVDDHLDIQAALDALPASGGKVVLLEGTFHFNSRVELDSYQNIQGQGEGTIITVDTDCTTLFRAYGGAGTEKTGVKIGNFRAVCTGGLLVHNAVYFYYVNNSEIFNIVGEEDADQLIRCRYCNFIQIDKIRTSGTTGECIYGDELYFSIVSHCELSGDPSEGAIEISGDNNKIMENILSGAAQGVHIGGEGNIIAHNTCSYNQQEGISIRVGSKDCIIESNYCQGNGQALNNGYANIRGYRSDGCKYSNNTCRFGIGGNVPKYGLWIDGSDAYGEKNVVIGNDLDNSGLTANFFDEGVLTHVEDNNIGIEITQIKHFRRVKNTSGGALAAGDVVVLKAVAAGNEITTTVVQGDDSVYGMVAEPLMNGDFGLVQVKGKTTDLKVNGTVAIAIGDLLGTYTVGGIAMKAGAGDQAFARALEAYAVADSAGVIDAYIKSPWD